MDPPSQLTPLDFRLRFVEATDDEAKCIELLKELSTLKSSDYTMRAYRAAATMSMAKYTAWPDEKLHYFFKGKKEIEEAVEKRPNDIEIRFLRLALQDYIPAILFYDNQEEDLKIILEQLPRIKEEWFVKEVSNYLVHMGHCKASAMAWVKTSSAF